MRRRLIPLAVVLALAASCYYGDPGATADPDTTWGLIGLTGDGTDTINVHGDLSHVDITAPASNKGGNTRIGWIVDGVDTTVNETCATFDSHTGDAAQPGLVVHFDGGHAYTATQNIWGTRQQINVHLWDLAIPTGAPGRFTLVYHFTPPGIGDGTVWPLRMCARAVGPFMDVKMWPTGQREPGYGDPEFSGGLLIGAPQAGRAGWYAGHVEPGGHMGYSDLWERAA